MKSFSLLILLCATAVLMAQFPTVTFEDIQFVDDADLAVGIDASPLEGDTVVIEGVVSMDPCDYALSGSGSRMGTFLQDPVGAGWGAMHVLIDPGASGYSGTLQDLNNDALFLDNFNIGNRVSCTGIVSSFSDYTQVVLLPIPSSITGFAAPPSPVVLTVDTFMVNDGSGTMIQQLLTGEKWEGVYVELQNVFATDISPSGDRFFWNISDGMGNSIPVRDMSGHLRNGTNDDECPDWLAGTPGVSNTPTTFAPPIEGASLSYIRGVIVEYTDQYYITPLTPSDIGPIAAAPPVISNITRSPVVATASDMVTVTADISDSDGTIVSAELNYSYGVGNTTYTTVAMSSGGGISWSAVIPGPGTDGETVNYWIRAEDNGGNISNSPDMFATGSFYIVLDAGITTVSQIQKNETGFSSIWAGDSLDNMNVPVTVTAGAQLYDLGGANGFIAAQDGSGPWSGIMIRNTSGIESLFRGDDIVITSGEVVEGFGVTYLENITYDFVSSGNPLPAFVTTANPDSIGANIFLKSEPWEGMLLRFDNAIVTDNMPDGGLFGEWRLNVGSSVIGSGIRVDDESPNVPVEFATDSVLAGETLAYVQGVLAFSFGNYKLWPRNLADIAGFNTAYPKSIETFNFETLVPTINATIDQTANTITATVPFGTGLTALTPTIAFEGQSVSPDTEVEQDFSSPVTYTVTAPIDGSTRVYNVTIVEGVNIGIDDISGLTNLEIYPNPSNGLITVQMTMNSADEILVRIADLTGKVMQTNEFAGYVGTRQINLNLSGYSAGTYLIELTSKTGNVVRKVQLID